MNYLIMFCSVVGLGITILVVISVIVVADEDLKKRKK